MSGYYLSIENPHTMRKELLESAKDSVEILKVQYAMRELRAQKMESLSEFANVVEEIGLMIDKIEDALPEHDGSQMPKTAQAVEKAVEAETKKAKSKPSKSKKAPQKASSKPSEAKAPKPDKDVDRAESALAALEKKLSTIESKLNKL